MVSSKFLTSIFLTVFLILSISCFPLQSSDALTQRDFSYLNDQRTTASNGNTKICGDHMCARGEWDKLQEFLAAEQRGHMITNATGQNQTHVHGPSKMGYPLQAGDSQTPSPDQTNPLIPGLPFPIPSPIPVPSPTPQTSGTLANQTSAYVKTDKPYYEIGMTQAIIVHIYGRIPVLQNGTMTVSIVTPNGVSSILTTKTSTTGYFSLPYVLGFTSPQGKYSINVQFNEEKISGSFYVVRINTYSGIGTIP